MPFSHRTRRVNPKLGVYFGIFTSAFISLALLALLFESLALPTYVGQLLMLVGPFALYAITGLSGHTQEQLDYFASGRRVPEVYSGLGLGLTALGATGLVGLTGAFFLIGFDALCLTIGALAGFVVMAILLAPFYRKFGAYTVPSYLGRRFDSRAVRYAAAIVLAIPMALILAAELKTGALAVTRLMGLSESTGIALLSFVLLVSLAAGGLRSAIWSSAGQSIAFLLAIVVILTIVAIMVTNLPFPQMSYGPVMRTIGRGEAGLGLPIVLPPELAFDFPGNGLEPVAKRFADAMGSVGSVAFVLAIFTTMAGVASAPWLLPRVAAAPGVYEARKSLGWATMIFGFVVLTIAPAAVFMRDYLIDLFASPQGAQIPEWFERLRTLHAAGLAKAEPPFRITDFLFHRDSILWSLPVAAELPESASQLVAAGVAALALAAAGSTALAIGNILAEDVANGLSWQPPSAARRLIMARIGLVVASVAGALVALNSTADPLKLLLWALALSGSAAFPSLVLSIWWKRLNAFGAFAALATGFTVAALAILAGEGGWMGVEGALAGAFGIPAGFAAAVLVTRLTPAPSKHVFELVRDIRVPGGEILYDREMLALKRKAAMRQ